MRLDANIIISKQRSEEMDRRSALSGVIGFLTLGFMGAKTAHRKAIPVSCIEFGEWTITPDGTARYRHAKAITTSGVVVELEESERPGSRSYIGRLLMSRNAWNNASLNVEMDQVLTKIIPVHRQFKRGYVHVYEHGDTLAFTIIDEIPTVFSERALAVAKEAQRRGFATF
jgi:hypothetical protein